MDKLYELIILLARLAGFIMLIAAVPMLYWFDQPTNECIVVALTGFGLSQVGGP